MRKYDADTIIHYIAMAKEIVESLACFTFIIAGLALVWFVGCALA